MKQQKFVRLIIQSPKGILLIHEVKGTYDGWNFPGGKIDPNETTEEAARRELWEEMNLKIKKLTFLYETNVYFNQSISKWYGYLYLAEVEDFDTLKIKEPQMCREWCFVPFKDLASFHKCAIPTEFIQFLSNNLSDIEYNLKI